MVANVKFIVGYVENLLIIRRIIKEYEDRPDVVPFIKNHIPNNDFK